MKRIIATLLSLVAILSAAFAVTSCGGRGKFDFSNAKELSDLKGAIIAAQTGTFHLKALNTQGKENGVVVKEYDDFSALLTALKSGVIDGYVAEEPTAYSVIAKNDDLAYLPLQNNSTGFTATEGDTGIAVAFKKGKEEVASVNAILAELSLKKREELMQWAVDMSLSKDKEGSGGVLEIGEVAADAPVLKIAMECAYEPYNWTQKTNANGAVKIENDPLGYANGYDVQIARYIAYKLGMKLQVYAAVWENLIEGVKAGTYDGIIAGMSPTEDRKKEVDFTDCYYNSNLVIIYKK